MWNDFRIHVMEWCNDTRFGYAHYEVGCRFKFLGSMPSTMDLCCKPLHSHPGLNQLTSVLRFHAEPPASSLLSSQLFFMWDLSQIAGKQCLSHWFHWETTSKRGSSMNQEKQTEKRSILHHFCYALTRHNFKNLRSQLERSLPHLHLPRLRVFPESFLLPSAHLPHPAKGNYPSSPAVLISVVLHGQVLIILTLRLSRGLPWNIHQQNVSTPRLAQQWPLVFSESLKMFHTSFKKSLEATTTTTKPLDITIYQHLRALEKANTSATESCQILYHLHLAAFSSIFCTFCQGFKSCTINTWRFRWRISQFYVGIMPRNFVHAQSLKQKNSGVGEKIVCYTRNTKSSGIGIIRLSFHELLTSEQSQVRRTFTAATVHEILKFPKRRQIIFTVVILRWDPVISVFWRKNTARKESVLPPFQTKKHNMDICL